jgi:hypothetical protein
VAIDETGEIAQVAGIFDALAVAVDLIENARDFAGDTVGPGDISTEKGRIEVGSSLAAWHSCMCAIGAGWR